MGSEKEVTSRQLAIRRKVQTLSLVTTEDKQIPHGSDWSSIREAGIKPRSHLNPTGEYREQVVMESESKDA
jgi:hypothetical protein